MDTFTCGSCKMSFTNLEDFTNHKESACHLHPCRDQDPTTLNTLKRAHEASDAVVCSSDLNQTLKDRENRLREAPSPNSTAQNTSKDTFQEEGIIFLCKTCNVYSVNMPDLKTHCLEVHKTPPESVEDAIIPLKPLNGTTSQIPRSASPVLTIKRKRGRPRKYSKTFNSFPFAKTGEVTVIGSEELTVVSAAKLPVKIDRQDGDEKPQTKRGRPRKSKDDKEKERQSLIDKLQAEEEERKKRLDTENLLCRNCGKTFSRLRQLSSHRCQFAGYEVSHDVSYSESDNEDDGDNLIRLSANEAGINSLDFDSEPIADGMDIPVHEVQQSLNDKALQYPRSSNSGSLKFYPCPVCKKVFKTKLNLKLHMSTHTADKPFKCSECDYSSTLKTNLLIHSRKHTNERLHCPHCNFSCISKGNLSSHMKKHSSKSEPLHCALCHSRVYSNSHLLRHLETEHDIKKDKKSMSYYKEMKMLCRAGLRNLIYQCHVCQRKFKEKRNYNVHLLLHQRNKPFKCTICSYTSVRSSDLEKHVRKHWFIFICHVCQTKFLSLELLNTHLASHEHPDGMSNKAILEQSINRSMYQSTSIELSDKHRSIDSVLPANENTECGGENGLEVTNVLENSSQVISQNVLTCELQELGEIFTTLHFKRLTYDLLTDIRNLYGDNECPICGKLFRLRPHLDVHKKTHLMEKAFHCEDCGYSSHTKQNLARHINTVHVAAKHKCPSCSFETTSRHYFQMHLKKHQGSDAFKCTQCDMITGSEGIMKRHIASDHPDLSRVELKQIMGRHIHMRSKIGQLVSHGCHLCGQVFRRVCDLRSHIWIHKGIYPYKCELCKFKCRSKSNLNSHMFRHSDAKNHLCDECGKSFKMKNALRTHRMVQHAAHKQHSCGHCEFTTPKESHLKHHINVHHQQQQVKTFRCFHCMQYTNTKDSMRSHYQQEHPDSIFDEALTYEVPEERITTLNISINHKDGALHYKCSQCDVLLANNGELGQHLRETHGLAITTGTDVDGEADPEAAGSLSSQLDLSSLPQGLQVQLMDSMSDKTSAEQFLQELIDIQEIAAAVAQVDRESGGNKEEFVMKEKDQADSNVSVSETIAAVNFLTASESLIEGGVQSQDVEQSAQYSQYVPDPPIAEHRSPQDEVGSVEEVISEVPRVTSQSPEVIQEVSDENITEVPEVIQDDSVVIPEASGVIPQVPDAALEQQFTDSGVNAQEDSGIICIVSSEQPT